MCCNLLSSCYLSESTSQVYSFRFCRPIFLHFNSDKVSKQAKIVSADHVDGRELRERDVRGENCLVECTTLTMVIDWWLEQHSDGERWFLCKGVVKLLFGSKLGFGRILEILYKCVSTVFTCSAITQPDVNPFGWNLRHYENIICRWP